VRRERESGETDREREKRETERMGDREKERLVFL
jgi:hypothetical protein